MKPQLHKYLNRFVIFNNEEMTEIYSCLKLEYFAKKAFILQEGAYCNSYYFILDGLVRSFYIDTKGGEKITQFGLENWWVTDLASFVMQSPSHTAIQAVENTKVLTLSKEKFEQLCVKFPKFERLFRLITEKTLIAVQRKNNVYLQMSSKDRYRDLVTNFPIFAQRVPQYMIASYLEITPEYLSLLRKE